MIKSVGSVCSGIEAASVAWSPFGVQFDWFSEIAAFPSRVLTEKYPDIPNLGDMNDIPDKINQRLISAPDLICGGTPCQAFSLAGWQNGLNDDRGNLTLRFVDIVESNDAVRLSAGKNRCKVFWENVEGVLTDKTNAFGCFISSLAGLTDVLTVACDRWPSAGLIYEKKETLHGVYWMRNFLGCHSNVEDFMSWQVEKISNLKISFLRNIRMSFQRIRLFLLFLIRMDTILRFFENTQIACIQHMGQNGTEMLLPIMAHYL